MDPLVQKVQESQPVLIPDQACQTCLPSEISAAQSVRPAEGPSVFMSKLFESSEFPARWHCGSWSQDLGWLHIVSDSVIFAAYFAIPATLLYFLYQRKDIAFPRIVWLFAAFILLCGFGHLIEAGIFWWPVYRFAGLVKAATAIVSVITVGALVKLIPQALALPSAARLGEELQDSRNRLDVALKGAQIGIWEWQPQTDAFQADESLCAVYSETPAETLTDLNAYLSCVDPGCRESAEQCIRSCASTHEAFETDLELTTKAGRKRHISCRGRFVASQSGGSVIGVCIDITESKRAERELIAARHAAEEASHAKSRFLTVMSHELRTPLNGVIGMTSLLVGTPLSAKQRPLVEACRQSGQSLHQLVNQILDLSEIDHRTLRLDESDFDLSELVGDTTRLIKARAEEKQLELSTSIVPSRGLVVQGDVVRIQQVLFNLLDNAIKFTETGRIEVSMECASAAPAGTVYARISVSDTGRGIPENRRQQVFESFEQLDGSMTRVFGGSGVGLAVASQLVRLMDGSITVQSVVGEGTEFRIELTLKRAANADSAGTKTTRKSSQQQPRETTADSVLIAAASAGHCLIVEDNSTNRLYLTALLEQSGFTSDTAVNGVQAIDAVRRREYDLILMDCQMPKMDGYEATRQIRRMEFDGSLKGRRPIVAVTANAVQGDRERCLAAGMDEYLTKPLQSATVTEVLRRFISDCPVRDASGGKLRPEPSCIRPDHNVSDPNTAPLPIDTAELLGRCFYKLDFSNSLLDELAATGPLRVDELRRHAAERDAVGCAETAHSLKGATGILGASSLYELTAEIEHISREADLDGIDSLICELSDEMDRCLNALPRVREQLTLESQEEVIHEGPCH